MPDDSSVLIEVDFKNALVEVVTGKAIKIGENWFPKSECKAIANYKKGQTVGIVSLPQWIVEAKNLVENAQKHAGEKAKEIVDKVVDKVTEPKYNMFIVCPFCEKEIKIKVNK